MTISRQQRRFLSRKGLREPGLTPIGNKRIVAALVREMGELERAGVDPYQAAQLAMMHVSRTLPAATGRRYHPPRPSKSDEPLYRNPQLRACPA